MNSPAPRPLGEGWPKAGVRETNIHSSTPMTSSLTPQRILMTADTVGGVWTYALDLIRPLQDHGVEVALATMGKPLSPEQWDETARLPNLQVFESGYKLEWMENPWEDVEAAGDWLLRLEDRLHPDVIHLNGYAHGALPWDAPVLMVGHSCVLSWWKGVERRDAPPEWSRYREEVTRGLRSADLVVAPTQAMLADMEQFYGPLPPCRVIPNARIPEAFSPGEKEPFIFTAGRVWDSAKNIGVLDAAAPRLPWPVYVAGDQQHPEYGIMELHHLKRLGRISTESVADWLSRASIYALPARYEPFGLSALEAALSGCALVLGDIPSLREVWGDAAAYVDPDDIPALEAALMELIADPVLRKERAEQALRRAQLYTLERQAQGYLDAYRQLLNRSDSHNPTPDPDLKEAVGVSATPRPSITR